MMISITSSQVTGEQAERVEAFLATFLPRMRKFPGVIAIYQYSRPEHGDEKTVAIWEDEAALRRYRESDLVKEAIAFEKQWNLASTRQAYPISQAY